MNSFIIISPTYDIEKDIDDSKGRLTDKQIGQIHNVFLTTWDQWAPEHAEQIITLSDDYRKVKFGDYLIMVTRYIVLQREYPIHCFMGRVIQIRINADSLGRTLYLIRMPNGTIQAVTDESFLKIPAELARQMDNLYDSLGLRIEDGNEGEHEYSINDTSGHCGFIVDLSFF